VQYAYWTRDDPKKLQHKDIALYNKFIAIVGCDLVRKLKSKTGTQAQNTTKLDFVV
jgi:hypothetical protein